MKSSLLRQISSKMVGIKRKMYVERKERERRFWSSETSEKRGRNDQNRQSNSQQVWRLL